MSPSCRTVPLTFNAILPNLYTRLGQIGLFRFEGVSQRSVIIEQYEGVLNLLPAVPSQKMAEWSGVKISDATLPPDDHRTPVVLHDRRLVLSPIPAAAMLSAEISKWR